MNFKIDLLLVLTLLLIVLLGSFSFLLYFDYFYANEFTVNGVYDKFSVKEVNAANKALLDYFESKDNLDTNFFNSKEKIHLKDVKELIDKSMVVFNAALIIFTLSLYFLYMKKDYNLIFKSLFISLFSLIIILISFFSLAYFDFSNMFVGFHYLAFNNNLWQLNPETDNLVVMFPEVFFYDFFKFLLIISLLISVVLFIVVLKLQKMSMWFC